MFRSIIAAQYNTIRTFASHSIQAPKTKIGLGNLADNAGAVSERTRVGRGPGYGKGKTAGRGHKGQKARSGNGKPVPWFEGGQIPLVKRLPKRGFYNLHGKEYQELNLDRLQHWINTGRIDATQPITMKHLLDSRCIHKIEDGVKILSVGAETFNIPITIEVSRASQKAIEAIEKAGGKITTRYYNALGLRAVVHPEKFSQIPKFAAPLRKEDIKYYSDIKNRGYLAQQQSSSLE
ncbi:ribosomal protein L18e/L15P [Halteromyces radiatus]|uniref:ribosomal protein L18e/L15P n=1 Tax=Halteromyces radiatus TaxID=101107 RepID=UPI00221EF83D|nr:ribosomal protein L18e/L15P [Halteromyces radiatus]KAI8092667.1 ribosomal protein L18e/L15P [Halteromyces radiatus]